MTEHTPFIDFENLPAPSEGFLMTQFLTVRSVARSRAFYSEVLGGQVVLEENPCMIKLSNSWLIMNPGGGPTPDKPDISVVNYEPGNTVSSFMNLRVADIQACYEEWSSKGAEFVTPPIDRGAEIRCYMRDPDGYMIEVGQSTGLLKGKLAKKRPEDLRAKGPQRLDQQAAVTRTIGLPSGARQRARRRRRPGPSSSRSAREIRGRRSRRRGRRKWS